MSSEQKAAFVEGGPVLTLRGGPPGDCCRLCGKVAYRSRAKATASARYHERRGGEAQRVYWSEECGTWHTSRRDR